MTTTPKRVIPDADLEHLLAGRRGKADRELDRIIAARHEADAAIAQAMLRSCMPGIEVRYLDDVGDALGS